MLPNDSQRPPPATTRSADDQFARDLRELNDALLQTSIHQSVLMEQAEHETGLVRATNDRFETIIDTAPFGVYLLDQELRFRQVSQKTRLVFGDIGELIGREFSEVVRLLWPPDSARDIIARFKHTLETGEAYYSHDFTELRFESTIREYYDWEIHRVALPDGQPGVVCYFIDISDRVLAEASSKRNAERLRFVIDSMPQKIMTAAADGLIDYFNPQWAEYTGLSFESAEDRDWKQFVHPDDLPETVRQWSLSLLTGNPFMLEHRFRQATGEYSWHLSRMLPLRDADGRISMWIGSNTDIHAQRQSANELRRYADGLAEADLRKNEFLAMVAHELRNPLAPIRNAVQVLQMANGDAEAVKFAAAILDRQVGQMMRLVEDLLDVNRFSLGKIELRSKLIELASLVYHAVEAVEPLRQTMDQILIVNLPPEPIFLYGDPNRLAQVIENLLTNACKFTHTRGQIRISVERLESDVVITVQDNGRGMSAEDMTRIFSLYTQLAPESVRGAGGLGIGLSLVQSLVTLHGGTVQVRSDGPGHGSTFIVQLPNVVDVPAPRLSHTAGGDTPLCTTAHRILVVDDNRDSANSLAALLQWSGNETRVAYDGLEAVGAAHVFRPDIILLDIGLPKISGYEACRQIRSSEIGGKIVMIALTGMGEPADRHRAMEAGFDEYIVKPVAFGDLDKMLTLLLANKH